MVISPAHSGSFGGPDTSITEVEMKISALRRLSLLLEKARQNSFELRYKTASHTRPEMLLKVSCTPTYKHIHHRTDHRIIQFGRDLSGCLSFIWSILSLEQGSLRWGCSEPWVSLLWASPSTEAPESHQATNPPARFGFSFIWSGLPLLQPVPVASWLELGLYCGHDGILGAKLLQQMSELCGGWKADWIPRLKGLWSEIWSPTGSWLLMASLGGQDWDHYHVTPLSMSIALLLFTEPVVSAQKTGRVVRHDWSLLNPCWLFPATCLFFMCSVTVSRRYARNLSQLGQSACSSLNPF